MSAKVEQVDLRAFWTKAHRKRDGRWLALSDPVDVLARLGVDLSGVDSILEVGPGVHMVADMLTALGKRVVFYDIVQIDDPRYVASLPLDVPVGAAFAHLVLQHVPAEDQRSLIESVTKSLVPGGRFYFDAISEEYDDNPDLYEEYSRGLSFPFSAWDMVTTKQQWRPGYFRCEVHA